MIWALKAFPGSSFSLIPTMKYNRVVNKNVKKPEDLQWNQSTQTLLSSSLANISTFHFYNKNGAEPFSSSSFLRK